MRYCVIFFVLLCPILFATSATRRQKRISGGSPVIGNKYPWSVLILIEHVNEVGKAERERGIEEISLDSVCTGSLIDVYGTILTAAHCFQEKMEKVLNNIKITFKLYEVSVRWGSNLNYEDDHLDPHRIETYRLSMINVHRYKSQGVHGNQNMLHIDLALLYLSRFRPSSPWGPINCSHDSTFRPIRLSKNLDSNPTVGSIAGFGTQPITREDHSIISYTVLGEPALHEHVVDYCCRFDQPVKHNITIHSLSVNISSGFYAYARDDENTPFDAATKVKYSGPCKGDSGGPYMENESGETMLRGVAFRTSELDYVGDEYPCPMADMPTAYVDLNYPEVRRWIIDALRVRYSHIGVKNTSVIPATCPE